MNFTYDNMTALWLKHAQDVKKEVLLAAGTETELRRLNSRREVGKESTQIFNGQL